MEIRTFIFFDLETTGLIQGNVMPKITEIALVAVVRESIYHNKGNSLPRILHKLVLPVNPQKIISPKAEYLTKLSNEDMQLLQPFECEIYELIMHFLQRLKPPICFAAHNGNGFDYPIFLWELECINKILDNKILCIDTYKMFQDFFRKEDINAMPYPSDEIITQDLLNDEYNESLSTVLDVVMMEEETKGIQDHATTSVSQKFVCQDKLVNILDKKHDKNKEHSDIDNQSLNFKQEANERTPESQIIKLQNVFAGVPFKKSNNFRRRLDFNCRRPVSLKLAAIYEHMFGTNIACEHSAEADCLAMIRCVSQIADFFIKWSDQHAVPFVCCKKI